MVENRKLIKMVHLMKREIDQNRITVGKLNSTVELKEQTEKNLNSKMVTIKSERDDYYNRYRTTEREINKIRNEFDSLSNWKKVYEDQNEQLQSELAKVRNLLAQSELQIQDVLRDKSKSTAHFETIKESYEIKIKSILVLENNLRQISDDKRMLENLLSQKDAEIQRLKDQHDEMQALLEEEFTSQFEQQATQIEDLSLKLQNMMDELGHENEQRSLLQGKMRELQDKNDYVEQKLNRVTQDLRIKETSLEESESEVQRLRKILDSLNE